MDLARWQLAARNKHCTMDFLVSAFGAFSPHRDEDAAVKFALNGVLLDNRLKQLAEMVVDGSTFGGMEGEPGWMLERRDADEEDNEFDYPGWPKGPRFKASVEVDAYRLDHPVFFMTRETFLSYVRAAVDAYTSAEPTKAALSSVQALRRVCGRAMH